MLDNYYGLALNKKDGSVKIISPKKNQP